MKQAKPGNGIPVELRLGNPKRFQTQGLARIVLTFTFGVRWVWWHTRSYVPIVIVLVLSLGSLLVLQIHWLYRRLVYIPARAKEVLKDAG